MADIYLLIDGKQEGPYATDVIQQALAWGFIPADLPAWQQGDAELVPVGSLLGLPKESRPWVEIYILKNDLPVVSPPHQPIQEQIKSRSNERKKNIKILIIDDGVAFTNIVKLTLELKGDYAVCAENNPLSAIATARAYMPDIILLDVIMPEMHGGEVQRQFKADPVLKDIPIIFLTATVCQKEVEEHHGKIGGLIYVAKPVSADGLVKAIEEHLHG